jgi:hypothetical protein
MQTHGDASFKPSCQHRLLIVYDSHASGTRHFFTLLSNLYTTVLPLLRTLQRAQVH